MVTFRWAPDPAAFDYLREKPVILTPTNMGALQKPAISEHSEQPRTVFADSILLTELTLQDDMLSGKVIHLPAPVQLPDLLLQALQPPHLPA